MARSALQLAGVRIESGTVAHVSALLGALFIVAGAGYLLKAWNLLYSTSGVVFGAGLHRRPRAPAAHPRAHGAGFPAGRGAHLQRRAWPAQVLAAH